MRVIESITAVQLLCQTIGTGKYAQAIISDFQKKVSAHTFETDGGVKPASERRSNGDRIRAMSDEQLVNMIYDSGFDVGFCNNDAECSAILDRDEEIPEENCKKCLMEWIKRTERK